MRNLRSVLVTGGTGSFGKAFIKKLLLDEPSIERIVIFSRDELKQYELSQQFSAEELGKLRFFIGDVRDEKRLRRAIEGIDTVIHAAALKHVPIAEYNPFECIKTNVFGSQNIVEACLDSDVKSVIALSTDKAAAPINLYGATKLCADKLFIAANNIKGNSDVRFSVVRYGNVLGSRGSVIPFFLKERSEGRLPITDPNMTRFSITLDDGVKMVRWAISNSVGGEIFVPKIPSYRITDVAKAIAPECELIDVGIRPGEKIHEEMITESDSLNTVDLGPYYAILPTSGDASRENYLKLKDCKTVTPGFSYNSLENDTFLSLEELKLLIKQQLDLNLL